MVSRKIQGFLKDFALPDQPYGGAGTAVAYSQASFTMRARGGDMVRTTGLPPPPPAERRFIRSLKEA